MSAIHPIHLSPARMRLTRRRSAVLGLVGGVVVAALLTSSGVAAAAPGAVDLGTAESFAVLAGSGITNTGPTTITGDIGTFPTPTETGFSSITLNGTNHAGDTVTQGAKVDLLTAYNDAAGRTPATSIVTELGTRTLFAGVYTSPTFELTGPLTLDAQGDPAAEFIFQAGTTLVTAENSSVVLINGADPCRVVWQVGSSATFGTATSFAGDVLANTSITAVTSATFRGRLLALDGAVTMDSNTITSAACAPIVPADASATASLPGDLPAAGTATGTGTGGGTPTGGTPSVSAPSLPATGAPLTAAGVVAVLLIAGGTVLHVRNRPARGSHLPR